MGTRRFARLATVLAVTVLAAGLVAGCAGGSPASTGSPAGSPPAGTSSGGTSPGGTSSGGAPSGGAAPVPSNPPPPGGSPLPGPGLPASGRATSPQPEQTITGQVEAGVERGCLVLRDSSGLYQLLGGDPTVVYAGATVSLTGHVVTGVMSYCMQGKPFQIAQARRL
jgi:hypothetical protein